MEFVNKITGYVLTLVLGAILVGGLLIPTVEGIQTNIGEEITLTNDSKIVLREIEDGDVLRLTRTVDSAGVGTDVWDLNGDTLSNLDQSSLSWNVGLISDAWYVQIKVQSIVSATAYKMDQANPSSGQIDFGGAGTTEGVYVTTFTASEGVITYTSRTGTTIDLPYTWGYVICNYEEGDYYSAETGGAGICKTVEDLILCGAYTTGDLDTMYAYHGGETYVSNSSYTMNVNTQLTKHSGTTDIYDITTAVIMSDGENEETFTPYRIFLPYEVTGHESSGTYYVMFGVVALLGIIMLVVVAANAIRNKY